MRKFAATYVSALKLTSHGDISGVRNAEVEVSALLESHIVPCYNYTAFASSSGCGAINWSGGGPIDSYDSSAPGVPPAAYGGNVGSNGNVSIASHTSITGQFSSPETGVGACSSGDAISGVTQAQLPNYVTDCESGPPIPPATYCGTNSLVQLPQTVQFTPPNTAYPTGVVESSLPTTAGTITPGNTPGCSGNVGCYGNLSGDITLMPYVTGTAPNQTCSAATYYINTISMNGQKSLTVAPCPAGTTNAGSYQPIILNIPDVNNSGSPLTLGGGSVANLSLNPAFLQIQYAGSGAISLNGGASAAAVLFAPLSDVTAWYGSLITSTLTLHGNGASLHYDRRLANTVATVGNWTMDTFTWSKY